MSFVINEQGKAEDRMIHGPALSLMPKAKALGANEASVHGFILARNTTKINQLWLTSAR